MTNDTLGANASALSDLTPADQVLFYRYGLGPERPVPFSVIHHAFEAQARAQPNAIAVEHISFNHSLTYHQLDVQANRLARRLRALGIAPGKRVCILVKRSIYLIVALLAVLKSGGQYVPLDAVTITDTALNYVLDNAEPSAILVMDEFAHRLHSKVPTLILEDVILADENSDADATKPDDTTSPSDGAYVVYTSGTTGVPKGVDVRHCGVANVIGGSPGSSGMCPGMRVSQLLNIAFDFSAWEILGALYNGATLCLQGNTKKERIELMKSVNIVLGTPSMLACYEPEAHPNIKQMMIGGEIVPQALADKWGQHTKFHNVCGPTEISIINTFQPQPHTPGYPLSIGKPIPNTNVYILSQDPSSTRPVPIGQVGCMWVGGIGVSAGYVNLPEKTAELWKPDPFAGKGRMMFNTRDLGRWRKDGQLDHLGRADDQVKINGFRVELDGVAAAMLTYEPVQSATAIVIGTELWGFVTPSTVDLSLVHNATAKVQPFYAVPRQYLAMDDFPITRNGKIDKRSLASLAASDSCEGVQRSAAWRLFASEIEQLHADTEDDKAGGDVLEVCKVSEFVSGVVHQVMGTTKIREDYDLFLQGCDSLKATFIRQAIQRALNSSRIHDDRKLDVPYLLVYDFPTVQRLTEWAKTVLSNSDGCRSSESFSSRITAIQDMVGKFRLPPRKSQPESFGPQRAPIVILITGTTGSLGSHMLSQAADDCRIRRIYAIGRALSNAQLQAKQKVILESRGLSSKFLGGTKVVMVAAETLDDVPAEILTEMKHTVTHIFHNSYPLNFNLGMAAFEPQFATVRALIDLAATSSLAVRPRIIFASSVGTLQNWQHPEWVPETKVDIETALGTGYSESKRVCELVLESAADAAGLEIVNVRIGQLCGSRSTGDWNPTDWFPILVASCKYLACLPDSADVCAWLPTDTAARAMLDIGFHERFDSSSRVIYRHLVHPRPSSWSRLVTHLSTLCARYLGHSVDLVSPDQWVNKIQNAASRPAEAGKINAVKLIGLWTSGALAANIRPAREVLNIPRLQTLVTETETPALRSCEPTCEADVDKWFIYWMKHDLLR